MKKCIVLYVLVTTVISNMCAQSPLCPSTATSFCCEYIESVTINGVTYNGPTSFSSGPGYFDYTNTSLTNLVAGNTYPVSIVVHTNSTYQEFVKIWFDFNGNGDLSDPGEIIFDQNYAFSGTFNFTGNFTVPSDAFNGDVYLRVMMVFSAAPELCGNYNYGNTLDFKANISNGVNAETLTVTTPNTSGSGHVISSNTGIDTANGIHSANYSINSLVTLNATANGTDRFIGWSGDASGSTNPLEVTMDASKNIIANFGPANTNPTISNISNVTECPGTETIGPINFTISDTESDTSNLTTSATSSNLTLLKNSNITIASTVDNTTITVIPEIGQTGATTITIEVSDEMGATTTTSFDLSIEDPIPPIVIPTDDINKNLDTNCEFSIPDYTTLTTATDNCGIPTVSQTPAVGTIVSGHNTVQTITLTANDGNGNTTATNFDITLIDSTIPTLSDVADFEENLDTSCEFSIPDYTTLTTATDNCGIPTVSQTPAVGTIISGHNTVQTITLTANDGNGNTTVTNFNITLIDSTIPTLSDVADFEENLDTNCEFSIPDYTTLTTATDNCGIPTVSQTPAVGTIVSGHNTVQTITLTANDGNGNTAVTSFNITLIDSTIPTLSEVADFEENLDTNCEFSIPDYTTLTTATDNCGIPTVSQTPAVGTIINGHNTVQTITLTADDGNGNTTATNFNITLIDSTIPTLSEVADFEENLDTSCEFSIPDYTTLTTATDNCGIPTVSQTPAVGTIINGHNTVQTITLTADDGNGNTTATNFNITLIDSTIPTLSEVADFEENLDTSCEFSIPDYTTLTTATDNCGIPTVSQTPAVGTIINGHNTVQTITLTADDGNGNTTATNFNITLIDSTIPTLSEVADFEENLDTSCEFSIPDYTTLTTATDNCGIPTVSQTPAVGTIINGHNTVQTITLTADDGNGNTTATNFNITLIDSIAPTAITQNITVQLSNDGFATITANLIDNSSTDNCGIDSYNLDVTDFTCSDIGQNTVTLTVTDSNGNSNSETAIVTVEDNFSPNIMTQDITVQIGEDGTVTITPEQINNLSTDNCGIASYSLDIDAFSCEHLGENTVTLTITDVNDNVSETTAIVTVEDSIAPTALAVEPFTVEIDELGSAIIMTAETIDNGSNDNCFIATMSIDQDTFTCDNLGENTVTLTVTDLYGNSASTTTVITVVDLTAPIIVTQDIILQLDDNGDASVAANEFIEDSFDNCSIAILSVDRTNFNCAQLGDYAVNISATDTNGNTTTEAAIVTVTGDDNDGDLISDACDPDDDNDGVLDDDDAFPFDSTPFLVPAEAITPNGDNINDFWIIPGINNYPNARIHVYNRWGNEVFRTKDYKNDWNGVYKSEKLPSGSYLYTIDLGKGSEAPLQGWIFINY